MSGVLGAGIAWGDLGSVIVWGLFAGVGLAIVFSLAIRGFVQQATARREGRSGEATANLALGIGCAVLSSAAVIFALANMLHR